jgi:hypothetical protein
MSPHMILQVTLGGESFLTVVNMTLKRLFTSMASNMSFKVSLFSESFLTAMECTHIGFSIILKYKLAISSKYGFIGRQWV